MERPAALREVARLTGFAASSQAAAFYLDAAGGDVAAAVRAAVQGSAGYGDAHRGTTGEQPPAPIE